MGESSPDDLIATWPRPQQRKPVWLWLRIGLSWAVALIPIILLAVIVTQAVNTGSALYLFVAAWAAAALGWMFYLGVRSLVAKVELRRSGLAVRSVTGRRWISWPEVLRTEVEQGIEFPTLMRRGPTIILHLSDGSAVRLWATETWEFGHDRRLEILNQQAAMIHEAHREFDVRTPEPPPSR